MLSTPCHGASVSNIPSVITFFPLLSGMNICCFWERLQVAFSSVLTRTEITQCPSLSGKKVFLVWHKIQQRFFNSDHNLKKPQVWLQNCAIAFYCCALFKQQLSFQILFKLHYQTSFLLYCKTLWRVTSLVRVTFSLT